MHLSRRSRLSAVSAAAAALAIPALIGIGVGTALAAENPGIAPGWEPQSRAIAALGADPIMIPAPAATPARSPFILSQPKEVQPFPIILNHLVQEYVDAFLNRPDSLEDGFARSRPYLPQMVRVLRSYGVPDDLIFLAFAESEFTRRGKGPWQFNKATAQKYGLHVNHWVDERRDPILSTRAAAEYLADLHDAAGSDWRIAIVGWNGGDLAIDRYWSLRGDNFARFMSRLPRRTRTLLARFMAVDFIAHNAAAYGIGDVDYDAPPSYGHVEVRGGTRLSTIARSQHTTIYRLRELNPAILHDRVPPYAHNYQIRVPLIDTASSS